MANVNPEFVERFQLEYEKNPRSRVFAALAEAYRKMGLIEEANRIASRGVQIHPTFAGGRVAFAKVLNDLKKPDEALVQLEKAIETSPENLLAHSLMGEVLLQLRRPKDALKSFKMVLFLNPNDERAKSAVGKWEFLSADDYDDELFAMKPVFKMAKSAKDAPVLEPLAGGPAGEGKRGAPEFARSMERAISLADAFTVRGEPEKALAVLAEARIRVGSIPELEKRFELLSRRSQAFAEAEEPDEDEIDEPEEIEMEQTQGDDESPMGRSRIAASYGVDPKERVRLKLETYLRRIEARRANG